MQPKPLFDPGSPAQDMRPWYRQKRLLVVPLLLLLLGIWLSDRQTAPQSEVGKPDPALLWMANHYPEMMRPEEMQRAYDSLIRGYAVPQTGLFLSFPGTSDKALVQQSATYDQGIVGVLLLAVGDIANAQRLLYFYVRAWDRIPNRTGPRKGKGGLANFYNAFYQVEGIEKTIHVGPNAWIGLFASRYYQETGDPKALKLALNIARWVMYRVPHTNGVVAMGEMPWNSTYWDKIYSTENNLSYYAFLTDLQRAKNLPAKDRKAIAQEASRVRTWLLTKAFQPRLGVIRGFHPKGTDTVGAIDSYTWYISSLRPANLQAHGISLAQLVNRAGKDFVVRIGPRSGIDPVDQHMAAATYQDDRFVRRLTDRLFLRPESERNPVIWYEGTGQYAVALQDAAVAEVRRAFQLPAGEQRDQTLGYAKEWLAAAKQAAVWMDDAAFKLPWGVAYPCATDGRFYLYGWPAPRGTENRPSDSVAALVWRLYAGMAFEPLSGTFLSPGGRPRLKLMDKQRHNPGTDLLLGASEEMVVRAWQLYEKKQIPLAQRQAEATIELWSEAAKYLQKVKQEKEGGYLSYDGESLDQFQKVHDYWALNDVCAAYFIIGRMAHERGDYAAAKRAFRTILKNYSLAQMWDKRGWFWEPVTTIQMEYAANDPEHYGDLFDDLPAGDGTPTSAPAGTSTPLPMQPASEPL